jgi:hypothetical protein
VDARHKEYFQGHYLVGIKAEKKMERLKLPAGSFFVPSGQPKGNLISYLLEPESDDNLVTWNYLDNYIQVQSPTLQQSAEEAPGPPGGAQSKGQPVPIYRIMKRTGFKSVLVDPGTR